MTLAAPAPNLRALYARPDIIILANIWDAGTARLAESAGAQAIATTSAGLAWSNGYADGAKLPVSVHLEALKRIRAAVRCPLTADMENGYADDPAVVAENVLAAAECGVSGINIEDGTAAPELLCRKIGAIKAACANRGIDLFINARTDVYLRGLATDSVGETVRRAALYKEAGADGLFVPGVADEQQIAAIVARQPLPVNVMAVPALPQLAVLKRLGVRRLSAGAAIAEKNWPLLEAQFRQFQLGGGSTELFANAADYAAVQALFG